MRSDDESLFPVGISDEAAVVLCNFLFELANACDSRYLTQQLRYEEAKAKLVDPESPWKRVPHKPD